MPRKGSPSGAGAGCGLSANERAAIRTAVLALDPMSDDQIAGVCEVIVTTRARWQRDDTTTG
jgi:hypothetical protein